MDQAVTNPDASITFTVTASFTNTSKKAITRITYIDEILNLYQVTLDNVSVSNLVQADPLPSLENKIFDFNNDFYPRPNQVITGSCRKLAKIEYQNMIATQSLLSPASVLSPGQTGTLTYTFTYFPLADDPSFPLESLVSVTGTASHKNYRVRSNLPLGPSPVAVSGYPRIGIAGAGLAGLTVAYRLVQAGYSPIVYEGSDRIGGRTFSGVLQDNQVFEHGGEFIDSDQADIMGFDQRTRLNN